MPDWFAYSVFREMVFLTLYPVARYRLKVVRENLKNSFPEKSAEELKQIERKFYRHLAEVMVDTIMLSGMSRARARQRIEYDNVEQTDRAINNRNWIAALAHYGSWEYFCAFQMLVTKQVVGVYRPLHSPVFDRYYNKVRSRFGLLPVSMSDLMRYIIRNQKSERGFVLGLISDQTPPFSAIDHWYDFLNQKTAFFSGIEKSARKFHLPVIFVDLRRVSRAHYIAHMEVLYDGDEEVCDYQITQRYVERLEQMIRREPQYWMWSHKRWKHKPENKPGIE
ncbi:acetyltransferase [Bacteroidia bacterium]|nr:acetyltransferase [Bacteroidia bacterium]